MDVAATSYPLLLTWWWSDMRRTFNMEQAQTTNRNRSSDADAYKVSTTIVTIEKSGRDIPKAAAVRTKSYHYCGNETSALRTPCCGHTCWCGWCFGLLTWALYQSTLLHTVDVVPGCCTIKRYEVPSTQVMKIIQLGEEPSPIPIPTKIKPRYMFYYFRMF